MPKARIQSVGQLGPSHLLLKLQAEPNFKFKAGQVVRFDIPAMPPGDGEVSRVPFAIASAETDPSLEILVEKHGGNFSAWFDRLGNGDEVQISKAEGEFGLEDTMQKDQVFLAFGVGVAPLRSMIRTLIAPGLTRQVYLLGGAQSPDDFLFKKDWEDLERGQVRFHFYPSEVSPAEKAMAVVKDVDACVFYLAGFHQQVDLMVEKLKAGGCPGESIKALRFD